MRLKEIIFTVVLLALFWAAVMAGTVPDQALPQAVTVEQLQEQIRGLEAQNQRQQEEIGKLKVSHEYAICVSEDLDSRLGRVEGRY